MTKKDLLGQVEKNSFLYTMWYYYKSAKFLGTVPVGSPSGVYKYCVSRNRSSNTRQEIKLTT